MYTCMSAKPYHRISYIRQHPVAKPYMYMYMYYNYMLLWWIAYVQCTYMHVQIHITIHVYIASATWLHWFVLMYNVHVCMAKLNG